MSFTRNREWRYTTSSSELKQYPEQGLVASNPASDIPPRPDSQCGPPHPPLSYSVEAARVIYILKPGKDPALLSSYGPINLLDTIGKFFGKILLARIQFAVSEHGLMRDEQFGFRTRHSKSLQLARHVERITRSFGENRLTGAVFLDVAKVLDTVWINGLLYKLTILYFPSYLVRTVSSYFRGRTFEASFRWPRNLVAACGLG